MSAPRGGGGQLYTHEAKFAALFDCYTNQFGSSAAREHTLNWDLLIPLGHDLHDLERDIS
jgi:hypothetical protein